MSRPRHLSRLLLSHLDAQEGASADDLVRGLLEHLAERCPECGDGAVELGLLAPASVPVETPVDYGPLVARAVATARRVLAQLAPAVEPGEGALRSLIALDPGARWLALTEPGRWRSPQMVEALLDHLRREAYEGGGQAEDLARFAVSLAERLDPVAVPPGLVHDLMAQGWALVGRELLAQGAVGATGFALRHAEALLGASSGDVLTAVRVRLVRAWWLWHLGDAPGAERELELLHGLVVLAESPEDEGELWLWSHLLCLALGRPAEARAAFEHAMGRLGVEAGALAFRRVSVLQERLSLHLARPSGGPPSDNK